MFVSFFVNPVISSGGDCIFSPFSYLIPVTLNEVPCVALVWPDSCARVSLSKSSSKQRIRQRWGTAAAALPGGAVPRVRSGSPFYCTACSPGCCPPRVWWMTTTLEEPTTRQKDERWTHCIETAICKKASVLINSRKVGMLVKQTF